MKGQIELLDLVYKGQQKITKLLCEKLDNITLALGGSPVLYNVTNLDVIPAADTYSSPECHSFSVSVLGTGGSISMDINGTSVTLPSGMNLNLEASTTFAAGMFQITGGDVDAVVTTITAT